MPRCTAAVYQSSCIVFTFENEPDTGNQLIVLVDIGKYGEVHL